MEGYERALNVISNSAHQLFWSAAETQKGHGHAALSTSFTVTAAQRTKQQVMQLCTQNTRFAPKQVKSLGWQSGHNSPSCQDLFEFNTAPMHSHRACGQTCSASSPLAVKGRKPCHLEDGVVRLLLDLGAPAHAQALLRPCSDLKPAVFCLCLTIDMPANVISQLSSIMC